MVATHTQKGRKPYCQLWFPVKSNCGGPARKRPRATGGQGGRGPGSDSALSMAKAQRKQPHRVSTQPFRLSPIERQDLFIEAFAHGKSITQLAEEFDRDRNTIARVLKTPEALKRKDEILEAIGQAARAKLARAPVRAADSWVKQLELVDDGQRGNHLPAKDLLTHTGVIDIPRPNVEQSTEIIIQIGGGSNEDIVPITVDADLSPTTRQVGILPVDDDVAPVND